MNILDQIFTQTVDLTIINGLNFLNIMKTKKVKKINLKIAHPN